MALGGQNAVFEIWFQDHQQMVLGGPVDKTDPFLVETFRSWDRNAVRGFADDYRSQVK